MNLGVVSRGTARKATTLDEPATGVSADAEDQGLWRSRFREGAEQTRRPGSRQGGRRRAGASRGRGDPRCHRRSWVRGRPRSQSTSHRASVGWTHSGTHHHLSCKAMVSCGALLQVTSGRGGHWPNVTQPGGDLNPGPGLRGCPGPLPARGSPWPLQVPAVCGCRRASAAAAANWPPELNLARQHVVFGLKEGFNFFLKNIGANI